MITIYTGIPGSGKTYKMVADLSRVKDRFYVVHNIDGLREGYLGDCGIDFTEYCEKEGIEVNEFFSKEYQIRFCEAVRAKYERNVLVIIDECHEWFDRNVKSLKLWLSYHRHIMQEIWLVAHKSNNLPSVYRSYIEVEYRAKHGSMISIPGLFAYNRVLGGQRVGYKFEKKRAEIFALYKSQVAEKPTAQKMSLLIPGVVAVCAVGFLWFINVPKMFSSKAEAKAVAVEKTSGHDSGKTVNVQKGSGVPAAGGQSISIEDRFAFVGGTENFIVVEERQTGRQFPLNSIAGRYVVIEVRRGCYARLYSIAEQREINLFSANRFMSRGDVVERSGNGVPPAIAASGGSI